MSRLVLVIHYGKNNHFDRLHDTYSAFSLDMKSQGRSLPRNAGPKKNRALTLVCGRALIAELSYNRLTGLPAGSGKRKPRRVGKVG